MNNNKILSIIIPVYNEEKFIINLLEKVKSVKLLDEFKKEIIIINDCSTDNTHYIITDYIAKYNSESYTYLLKDKNEGKGAAIKTGISVSSGEIIIIQDADLEYDPEEYNILLKPIIDGFANVVYGSRFIGGKPHRILFFWHSLGNKILTFLSNMLTNLNLTDMETCFKAFKSDILKNIDLKEKRFGFEPEVTAKISKLKQLKLYEVGISYYGRTFAEGKKIGWKDGFRAIYCIIKYRIF
jgi:glycosyltransferase involved in cell wall biosynthesis